MNDTNQQPPVLWQLFAEGIFQRFVKKPLLGKPYLEFTAHAMLAAKVYEQGAILGRARSNSLALLLQMCSSTDDTSGLEGLARQWAEGRLANCQGTPGNFLDFYLTSEAAKGAGQALPSGAGFSFLEAHGKRKLPLETSVPMLAASCTEGLAFGVLYPDLLQAMLRNHPVKSVLQLEQEVLSTVAAFAATYYTHLVEPLKLAL